VKQLLVDVVDTLQTGILETADLALHQQLERDVGYEEMSSDALNRDRL